MPNNAVPIINGWNFQFTCGVILFFSYIKEIKSIKMEGKDEDIEIILNDDSKIYCQCKSIEKYENHSNPKFVQPKTLSALSGLEKCNNCKKLIYMSNICTPFLGTDNPFYSNIAESLYSFDDLPSCDQKTIKAIIKTSGFDFSKLYFYYVHFFGEEGKKKLAVKKINEFCISAKIPTEFSSSIFNLYLSKFVENGSQHVFAEKKNFIFPLAAIYLDSNHSTDNLEKIFIFDDYDDIIINYSHFINAKLSDYEFLIKYISEYESYRKTYQEKSMYDFINERTESFLSDFDLDCCEELKKSVVKFFLYKLLRQKITITSIKGAAGL